MIHYTDERVTLHHGDCLDVLRELPDNSVDAVVCDPPYGLANTTAAQVADTLVRWVNGERDYIPAGSGFMGRSWDAFVPPVAVWDECYRVLKPGGHVLAFAGARTHDLMGLGIRLAGFDIRDSIVWLQGAGFPKSLDVGKAIDKARTEDREPVDRVRAWLNERRLGAGFSHDAVNKHFGHASNGGGSSSAWMTNPTSRNLPTWDQWQALRDLFGFDDTMDTEVWRLNGRKGRPGNAWDQREVIGRGVSGIGTAFGDGQWASGAAQEHDITAPATDLARQWHGWGTALKPAQEPIVVARKPLAGTVAQTVTAWGTGALNIGATRVDSAGERYNTAPGSGGFASGYERGTGRGTPKQGRWPTNVVLTHAYECGRTVCIACAGTGQIRTCAACADPDRKRAIHAPDHGGPAVPCATCDGRGSYDCGTVDQPGPCVEGCPVRELDAQSGVQKDGVAVQRNRNPELLASDAGWGLKKQTDDVTYGGSGGASRYFPTFRYEAKAPTSERPRVTTQGGDLGVSLETAHPT